jgi:hypothetical protein
MYVYDSTSLNSSQNEKCFRQKLYRKSKYKLYVHEHFFKNCAIYGIMWKSVVELERPHACALHAG